MLLIAYFYLVSGGGSGGYIAVYTHEVNGFSGIYLAVGGKGHYWGSPGTLFIEVTNGNDIYRSLDIDGNDAGSTMACDYPFTLDDEKSVHTFDDVSLKRKGCLQLKKVGDNVKLN